MAEKQENNELSIVGRECRFAIHIPANPMKGLPDVHMIKEQVHYSDGTVKPNIKFIQDFQRPLWVTRQQYRNHSQKKEWEQEDKLMKKECTQSKLRDEIATLLNKNYSRDHLKKLSASPYVYGTDITSTSIIKKKYLDKYPELNTTYTVAAFDIETDVLYGTNEAILASLAFTNKLFIVIQKKFIYGFNDPITYLNRKAKELIGKHIEEHNIEIEYAFADDVVDLIRIVFAKAHEWKPDFLAIWNMDFDIPQILRMMKENNVDPKDILCDPEVPKELRICHYKPGPDKKTTASGKVIPINPAARWHTLHLTASFYVIDAMCAYKHIRLSKQEEPSYSLDAILFKELKLNKLKIPEAKDYDGLKLHQFMQKHHPIEYAVYNGFDTLSMILLDNHTKDLCRTLPAFSASSDFAWFKSQPRRIADALHFFLLDRGYVLAATGSADKSEEDNDDGDIDFETLSLDGWIITLPAHMSVLGMACILEDQLMRTGIRAFVYDSDAVSAYPSCISVANVSKDTTKREIIAIQGIDEEVFRMQNINLVAGSTNALEYSTVMFNLPKPEEVLKIFLRETTCQLEHIETQERVPLNPVEVPEQKILVH